MRAASVEERIGNIVVVCDRNDTWADIDDFKIVTVYNAIRGRSFSRTERAISAREFRIEHGTSVNGQDA